MASKVKTRKRKSLKGIKKLSTLLALGLRDLRKQERAKNSVVYMSVWWQPRSSTEDKCYACLAGSVMKFGLTKPRTATDQQEIGPSDYDNDTYQRLHALNLLRTGDVPEAAFRLRVRTSLGYRDIPDYQTDSAGWWSAMKQLLADLKAAGE